MEARRGICRKFEVFNLKMLLAPHFKLKGPTGKLGSPSTSVRRGELEAHSAPNGVLSVCERTPMHGTLCCIAR